MCVEGLPFLDRRGGLLGRSRRQGRRGARLLRLRIRTRRLRRNIAGPFAGRCRLGGRRRFCSPRPVSTAAAASPAPSAGGAPSATGLRKRRTWQHPRPPSCPRAAYPFGMSVSCRREPWLHPDFVQGFNGRGNTKFHRNNSQTFICRQKLPGACLAKEMLRTFKSSVPCADVRRRHPVAGAVPYRRTCTIARQCGPPRS